MTGAYSVYGSLVDVRYQPRHGYRYIYHIVNRLTGVVIYVGQTRQAPQKRLAAHYRKHQWPTGKYIMHIVKTVRACNADRCERAQLKRFPNMQLWNVAGYRKWTGNEWVSLVGGN